jgi:SAM-dependent methyltransferase
LLDGSDWGGGSASFWNSTAYAGGVACRTTSSQTRCPVCEAWDVVRHQNNLSQCGNCQHIFQTDLKVAAVYDADYAHQYDHRPHREMSILRWNFIQRWLRLPAGSCVLDIGYGNGALLKHARARGMEVFGIDVHGENFGIPTVDYDTDRHFDLICFFDSLEHLPSFDCLFRLRAAHVVVSLPAVPDYLLQAPHRWRHYKPGEHLHYFSAHSLSVLMSTWGLRRRIADGSPEDALRGKLQIDGRDYDNIYTAVYCRGEMS